MEGEEEKAGRMGMYAPPAAEAKAPPVMPIDGSQDLMARTLIVIAENLARIATALALAMGPAPERRAEDLAHSLVTFPAGIAGLQNIGKSLVINTHMIAEHLSKIAGHEPRFSVVSSPFDPAEQAQLDDARLGAEAAGRIRAGERDRIVKMLEIEIESAKAHASALELNIESMKLHADHAHWLPGLMAAVRFIREWR